MITRRQFSIGLGTLAFSGLLQSCLGQAKSGTKLAPAVTPGSAGYGPLLPDPKGLLDLPEGFSYQVLSQFGETMSDGLQVPDRADGMGCIALDDERVALVRNHELHASHLKNQPKSIQTHKTALAYDSTPEGVAFPGGTSSMVYNLKEQRVERSFMSLTGTARNCSGGVTPWGSWLTCEENVERAGKERHQDHGYVFEVPATSTGLIAPKPIKAMGRFNHEAAAVDPRTGIVYMTEDRDDGLFYRFIPNQYGKLEQGGRLQALMLVGKPQFDSRNWDNIDMAVGQWQSAQWVDLDNPESPEDDLRKRGFADGAAIFARGEGIHWGQDELYFCATSGGHKELGQILRYQPSADEGKATEAQNPGRLQLFLESSDKSLYNFGDNLTVASNGHLIVCEDQYSTVVNNQLRGVTPEGAVYSLARLKAQTELAGACFSPDGSILFVNVYSPAKTLAIRGPWQALA